MPEQPTLTVESRTHTGSHLARKLRRQNRIPAVLYGHGAPQIVTLDMTEFRHTVTPDHYGSQMVRVSLDGADAGMALVKAVQTNPLGKRILAVDLQRVAMTDQVQVAVAVVLTGEPVAARAGGVLEQLLHHVNMRCRASEVPAELTFDVSSLDIGDNVHAGQLAISPACELLDRPDEVVAIITAPSVPVEEEPVDVTSELTGPELTGGRQREDFPPER